jgi:hypothetical protein
MLSIIEKLKAENDQLYLKLSDYELLTNKSLTFKIRLGEIEKLRDENAKLKQKLIKFDELNVRSASLNSTNSIIDDLKRQLQDYPRLINEINVLTDKIRQLEAIIEKDNHIKLKIKDFEEIYNQNIQFKYQLREFTKFGLDNKILIEQNLIVNDKNNELNLEINKLKIKNAKLYEENILLVKNKMSEENYEINKLKKQISSLEAQTDELIILKEAMIKLIEERDRNNIEIPILKEKLSVLDRDLNLHMKKFESWKGIYLDMISINDLEIKSVNDNNIRFKLIISQKKN